MSEPTGPKTWGDVIECGDPTGELAGYYSVKGTGRQPIWVATVAYVAANDGIQSLATAYNLDPDHVRIILRWLLADRPPLTDPIPPETPEPVAKVVRWTPTEEDAERIIDECNRVADDMNDCREEATVLIDAIRDCQRDLPEVEPPTPPMSEDAKSQRIDELERLLVEIGDYAHDKSTGPAVDGYWAIRSLAYDGLKSDLPTAPSTDRIDAIQDRLSATDSFRDTTLDWMNNQNKSNHEFRDRLAALESRAILKPDYDPRDVALIPPPAPVDGWQTEPPTVDCPCWVEVRGGLMATLWEASVMVGTDRRGYEWSPDEIARYYPCLKPKPSPSPIGRSAYNTPTTFEQAMTVGPQVATAPEIPLPDGCTAIEGFPLLCVDRSKRIRTRSGRDVFPWYESKVKNMRDRGMSEASISQVARYAIEHIAKDAGLSVVVK